MIVISSIFLQQAEGNEGGATITFNKLSGHLKENGSFSKEDITELWEYSRLLDLDAITDHLIDHYGEITIQPLLNYIDWDGDGIAGNEWENGGEMLGFETEMITAVKEGGIYEVGIHALTGYTFLDNDKNISTPYDRLITSPVDFEYELTNNHTVRIAVQPSSNAFMLPGILTIQSLNGNHSARLIIAQEPDLDKEGKDPHPSGSTRFDLYMGLLAEAFNQGMAGEALYTHTISPPACESSWMHVYENDLNPWEKGIVPNRVWEQYQDAIRELQGWKEYLEEQEFPDDTPYAGIANMQALLYYHMILLWDNVVYMPSLDEGWREQLNSKELFPILEKDIQKALELFPEGKNNNLIFNSKNFPRGLLANMYLMNGHYEKALPLYEEIINSNQYNINRTWEELFQPDCEDHVMAFPKNHNSEPDNSIHWISPGSYLPLMTYSEIILCAAECELYLGNQQKAMDYISQFSIMTQRMALLPATPRDALLVMEGIWRDRLAGTFTYFAFLKRNDFTEEMLGIENFRKAWPIPGNAMSKYPFLIQNPGY